MKAENPELRRKRTAVAVPDLPSCLRKSCSQPLYKMQFCSCLLVSGLLSIAVLHCSVDGVRVQHRPQHLDRPMSGEGSKEVGKLPAKLLRLDDMGKVENDVMEPKRKRSFPGNNAPLDRLSISSMETKQVANKQSKVVELPRRRVNPPPIDRIGMSRLPNSQG